MEASSRRAGPRETAALRAALPCRPELLNFTNDFDAFATQIAAGRLPLNGLCQPLGSTFEHSGFAVQLDGAFLSLGAHSAVHGNFRDHSWRSLVVPYAGALRGVVEGRRWDVSVDDGGLVNSGAGIVLATGEIATAALSFNHAALESHVSAICGEATRLAAHELRIPREILENAGQGAIFASAVRIVTEAQATPNLLSDAQARDLLMRATALMTIDALSLPERASTGSDASRAVRLARDHMMRRLSEDCTLTDIERAAGVSRRTLQLHFLKTYGLSPMQYLREQRLLRAREMLVSGRCAGVTEAALACGFTHLSSFSGLYRARFGVAPREALRR